MDAQALAAENLLFKCRVGSHAYGMAVPTSDLDVRGVFAAGRFNLLTPFAQVDEVEGQGDTKFYELTKYVRLVCDQNPNIVELLWVDPADVLFETPAWGLLKAARSELLTTKVRATYGGFAKQQLERMKGHQRWINNPQPEQPPLPMQFVSMMHNMSLAKEFNRRLPTGGAWTAVDCGKDLFLLFEGGSGSWFDGQGALRVFSREEAADVLEQGPPAAICKFVREEYESRKRDWDNYWTWQRNRNKVRGALEEKTGYDCKNAAHLLRLMRTAVEILETGVVLVRRPDAAELLQVRLGERSYEWVMAEAERLEARLAEAERKSRLPRRVDQARIGEIVMEMYEAAWRASARRASGPAPTRHAVDPRGRVVVLDVEGTGFGKGVVEIAAVEVMGGRRTGRVFHSYVDPMGPVSPYATRIHGLTQAFLEGKPAFEDIAPGLLAFLGDAPLVAHNAESDLKLLNSQLARAGEPPLAADRLNCSQRMARHLFGAELSLDALCDTFGVDRSPRERGHSALVDASLLSDCLLRMAEMPGYGAGAGLRRRAARAVERAGRQDGERAPAAVAVEVSEDGGAAVFRAEDGRVASAAVPPFPADTHRLLAHPQGALLVLRRPDVDHGCPPGWMKKPDNPLGPAVLALRGDKVVAIDFVAGKPAGERDAAEPPAPAAAPGPR